VENDSLQWIQNSIVAPFSRENLIQYASSYDADPFSAKQLRLIITDRSDRKIGIADLFEISPQHRTAKVGIYILPSCRCSGFALSALSLLEDYASRLLNLRSLCADIIEGNDESLNLFLKAGYILRGTLTDWILSGRETFSLNILQKTLL
ncbi:MAG: GNAT family N-acetyltransferase, partial [Muribaculaceae bacterium]|nr:GNAT family N-acetyltransferase [Muribaculaceae bacterium]